MNRRRLVDAAFLLPWIGLFLLTPPVVVIVQTWSTVAGIPLFIVYIFVCWFALIVLGRSVSSRLGKLEDEDRSRERSLSRLGPVD